MRSSIRIFLKNARESSTLAIGVYNNPSTAFRSRGFIVMMNIAWMSLFHAIFLKKKIKAFYRDPKHKGRYLKVDGEYCAWDLKKCAKEYFKKDMASPIFANLTFFIKIRNKVEHHHAPEVDTYIFGECQSYLINFEEIMVKEFGSKFALAETLMFSLQYSRIRTAEQLKAIKKPQAKHLKILKSCIDQFRSELNPMVLSNPEYSFKVFLIPKPANRQSAGDIAMEFIKFDPNDPDQMKKYEHLVTLIKEKVSFLPSFPEKGESLTQASIRINSSIDDPKSPVGITYDPTKASGTLLVSKLSEEIFSKATGFVDAAIILNKLTGEFPFTERSIFLVYSDSSRVKSSEAQELFLKASYLHYIPFFYWLTVIKKDKVEAFLHETLVNIAYPRVLLLFRLIFAIENEKWIDFASKKVSKFDSYSQKPQWCWFFRKLHKKYEKGIGINVALESGDHAQIGGKKISVLKCNSRLAKIDLINGCKLLASGNSYDKTELRKLDLLAHFREIKKILL